MCGRKFESGAVKRMSCILKTAVFAVFAAALCIGCGDKNTGGGGEITGGEGGYLINFKPNGGTVSYEFDTTGADGKLASLPAPQYDGHDFNGWFTADTGGVEVDTGYVFTADAAIYARWAIRTYTVAFDSRGGGAVSAHYVEHGGKTTEPKDPTLAGYNFDGWFKDSAYVSEWDFDVDVVNGSMTLYAKWTTLVVYVVTFDAQGGSAVSPQHVENGKAAVEHPSVRAGYDLEGWYKEAAYITKWDFAGAVTGAMTLYAKWTAVPYAITYLGGGTVSPANPADYTIETAAFTLNNPVKAGYTFTGWTGDNGATPHTTVSVASGSTGDKSYTANWSLDTYNITYSGGGTVSSANPASYTVESAAFTLNNPAKTGWTFTGWTGTGISAAQVTVSIPQGSTGDRAYTANWTFDGTFIDSRDKRVYKKVEIGTQVWMGENLNYVGDDGNDPLGLCYGDDPENCGIYGRLYDWASAMNGGESSELVPSGVQGVCPVGWHLPSDAEWTALTEFAGSDDAGTKLKSPEYWQSYSDIPAGTDDFGFSALPGGWASVSKYSYDIGKDGRFWTATSSVNVSGTYAYYRYMSHNWQKVGRSDMTKSNWYSVRCVQD